MAQHDQKYIAKVVGQPDWPVDVPAAAQPHYASNATVVEQLPLDTYYMTQENREVIRDALDSLGAALTNHRHTWSTHEAEVYNRAVKLIG